MGMVKVVATEQLKVLLCVVLLGTAYRAVPANPATANACGEDLYVRVVLAHHFYLLTVFSAAILLVTVRSHVRVFEALAARAAAAAGAKAFDADREGIGSVAPGWRRFWQRGPLLVGVLLSFAASVFAVVSFEDGFLYRTGCDADHPGYGYGYGSGSPLGALMMGFFALLHGLFAWAAVSQNWRPSPVHDRCVVS